MGKLQVSYQYCQLGLWYYILTFLVTGNNQYFLKILPYLFLASNFIDITNGLHFSCKYTFHLFYIGPSSFSKCLLSKLKPQLNMR